MDDVMDSTERTEAALTMFSGDEGQNTDKGAQGGERTRDGSEVQPGAETQTGREQTPAEQPAEGQLTDEQLNADPRFKELSGFKDSVVNAFGEFPGLVDDKGNVNVQEAGLQLKDASILYDIMQGKGTPSALLDIMSKNGGWTDQQKQLVANDLIGWLQKSGYLKGSEAAGKKEGMVDPMAARLDKLENDRKTEAQQRADAERAQYQEKVYREKFLPAVEKLCKQKNIPQEDFADYVAGVAGKVRGNKAVIARIEQGNTVDISKFFNEIYNAEVQRLKRWTTAQTKAADAKSKNPRIPAGGAPPQPAGSAKTVNVKDRDSRIAAAADML